MYFRSIWKYKFLWVSFPNLLSLSFDGVKEEGREPLTIAGSYNGSTLDFDSSNVGSIPAPAAKDAFRYAYGMRAGVATCASICEKRTGCTRGPSGDAPLIRAISATVSAPSLYLGNLYLVRLQDGLPAGLKNKGSANPVTIVRPTCGMCS